MCLDMFVAQLAVKRPLLLCGRYPAQRDLYRSNNTYQKLLTSRFIIGVGLQPRWMNIILYIILRLIQSLLILCVWIILL